MRTSKKFWELLKNVIDSADAWKNAVQSANLAPCSCQKIGEHKVFKTDGPTRCTVRTLPTGEHIKTATVIVGAGTFIERHLINGEVAYEVH